MAGFHSPHSPLAGGDAKCAPKQLPPSLPLPVTGDLDSRHTTRPSRSWAAVVLCVSLLWLGRATYHFCRHAGSSLRNPAYLIEATNGAVATENRRCSDIGVDVLKDGGNALDAAIAASLCIGVVNMFSSGLGGGGFVTVRLPPQSLNETSEVYTLDFREVAPALSNSTMYRDSPIKAIWGGLSIGVPGEMRGFEEAHRRWGKLPWERLFQPSIELARGWRVDRELGKRIARFSSLMLTVPEWSDIFAPNGRLLREGEPICRTNYSRTLETIAAQGADAFYQGPIADAMVRKVQESGGIMTHADLANYSVKVDHALQGTYRGRKVYTTRAPASGSVLLHMLNIMEHYDLAAEGRTGLNVHRLVEALKFGFAARTKVADPMYGQNSALRMSKICTKEFADLISANVTDDTTHPPDYYNPEFDVQMDHGTSHTSAVDKDGMAVALTTTVNVVFGSQVMDPITGIIFNDEMEDFAIPGYSNAWGLRPSPYNYPEPGKRPLSSMIPTIIEHPDGSFYASIGGSGGGLIPGAVLQTIFNFDEWGMDVSSAIEFGRVHDQLYPLQTDVDDIYPPELVQELVDRGHNVSLADINRVAAAVHAVVRHQDGKIFASSDSRKNGIAAGY